MGFYAPAQLVRDARAHGVKVLPIDINASGWHAALEVSSKDRGPAIRLGLEQVHGLGEAAGRRIEAARRDGTFRLPRDLVGRAGLEPDELVHLARAGALGSLGLDRRRAVWEAMGCRERPGSRPLLDQLDDIPGPEAAGDPSEATAGAAFLPRMSPRDEVIADYRSNGLSLTAHPVQFERDRLATRGVATVAAAVAAPEGRRVAVAGIVLTRQRPATAKGMIFLTIEDETGAANVVVRPGVWSAASAADRRAAVLVVHGRIQRRGTVVHVLATRLEAAVLAPSATAPLGALPRPALAGLPRMSRDFC